MIKIVGDICFSDGYFDAGIGVGTSITKGANPFSKIQISNDDFWIGNFECVAADSEISSNKEKDYFIINPSHLQNFKHFDIYGVANNHVMQHGEKAYNQTLSTIEKLGAKYVGSEGKPGIIFEYKGKKIYIRAFSQRPENFNTPLYSYMPEYKNITFDDNSDYKIAYIHWGNEFMNYPYLDQRQFAHYLVDKGFDLIIGMHPHVLQGVEIYKDKHIFYSLGNFVFNMAWEPTKYGAVVNLDFNNGRPEISYDYIHLGKDCFPEFIEEDMVPEAYRFSFLNKKINHEIENELYYSDLFKRMGKYRKANYKKILSNFFSMGMIQRYQLIKSFVKRKIK